MVTLPYTITGRLKAGVGEFEFALLSHLFVTSSSEQAKRVTFRIAYTDDETMHSLRESIN